MTIKSTLVLGGSGGIGAAICRRLAAEGDRVTIAYRSNRDGAEQLREELGESSATIHCDLLDPEAVSASVQAAVDRFDRLDSVIFAGGVSIAQPFVANIDEDAWRAVIETELIGFTRVVRAAIPVLRANGGGSITAVTSVATVTYPPGDALSAVPKAAIEMLGRAVAKEEGRNGIRVNMVAPGILNGGLGADSIRRLYTPEIWDTQRRKIALRRFGIVEEIAEAVQFLASDRSSYITGQTLVVDGGFSL